MLEMKEKTHKELAELLKDNTIVVSLLENLEESLSILLSKKFLPYNLLSKCIEKNSSVLVSSLIKNDFNPGDDIVSMLNNEDELISILSKFKSITITTKQILGFLNKDYVDLVSYLIDDGFILDEELIKLLAFRGFDSKKMIDEILLSKELSRKILFSGNHSVNVNVMSRIILNKEMDYDDDASDLIILY